MPVEKDGVYREPHAEGVDGPAGVDKQGFISGRSVCSQKALAALWKRSRDAHVAADDPPTFIAQ